LTFLAHRHCAQKLTCTPEVFMRPNSLASRSPHGYPVPRLVPAHPDKTHDFPMETTSLSHKTIREAA